MTTQLRRGVLGFSLALAVAGTGYWLLSPPSPTATPAADPLTATRTTSEPAATSTAVPASSEQAELLAQQSHTSDAAARAVGTAPYRGAVTERPEFVSEIEWQILKAAARQQADSTQALTRMVNQLRFEKQQEIWQQLPTNADPAQRTALARQLLQEVPERVSNGEMDVGDARRLQAALLAQLEPEPRQRSQLIRREAERLHPPTQ